MTITSPAPSTPPTHQAFRDLPFMGVIHVNNEAMKAGWKMGDPAWSNLGQGQPEVGEMAGAPPRMNRFDLDPGDHAYGPVEGIPEYRQAIADHYNRLYRRGHASQYTIENVAAAPGGRAALTRLFAILDRCRLGYFTPDYTAYEDALNTFTRIDPVHIELQAKRGFTIEPDELAQVVQRERLHALLISNPCNPTGVVVKDRALAAWVDLARTRGVTLLMDEFYSHFHYVNHQSAPPVSAAAYVQDVNADPVVIVDGLTKCFRYPGWRSGWIIAPKWIIQKLAAAGSFLDGGPSRPVQRAGIQILQPQRADQETSALRAVFAEKQRVTRTMLESVGVKFPAGSGGGGGSESTFYLFGDISGLPKAINTGDAFMREGFRHRVLTVPGRFFDVNPGKLRTGTSRLEAFVRFSFGPPMDNLKPGLERLVEMIKEHQ
jgi:aspartate/methionine/tyrosine aminotransferase